jgi:hypothetical protein
VRLPNDGFCGTFHKNPRKNPAVARPRKLIPSYCLHPKTGRARAVWTDTIGNRHD